MCSANDPNRHDARKAKTPKMIVSVDTEGVMIDGIMRLISASYGREDGTSKSLSAAPDGWLTAQQIILWYIDELACHYTDSAAQEWIQTTVAFHFGFDSDVMNRDFVDDLTLVHKSTARKRGLLCWTKHEEREDPCYKFHRDDQWVAQQLLTEGGEGDVLVFHDPSKLAVASSPKRRFYAEHRPNGDRFEGNRRLDIHDTGTAFVGGLLRVLAVWQPTLSPEQHAAIEWGKQSRYNGFLDGRMAQIEEYSEAECVAHARVCRLLLDTIRDAANIRMEPDALFGSGSIAGAAFKFHRVLKRDQTHEGKEKFGGILVDDLARLTYYGGLIETPVLGALDQLVDEVDINSAYPSQAIKLPCMRAGHGHWTSEKGWSGAAGREDVGHVRASWMVDTPSTPPFTVRTSKGFVRQPLVGDKTWVTLPEFWAAIDQFGDDVVAHETVWWVQECECENPLAWLAGIYARRQEVKQEMKKCVEGTDEWQALNCRQEALKLIINSCYGKLAQQRHGGGSYTNLHWASFITGATRAAVRTETWLREKQGGTVVYQHTDSVLSIDGVPVDGGKALGAWGMEHQSDGLVIVQPGLAVSLVQGKAASRGCSAGAFREAVDAWVTTTDLTQHPLEWPPITIKREQMISRRTALARGKPWQAGSFVPADLTVSFGSAKRDMINAEQLADNPRAWRCPPVQFVPDPATVNDLKNWLTALDKRVQAGEFDDTPLPTDGVQQRYGAMA